MDLIEITEKERLSRKEAAARLRALADALAKHNEVEFERGPLTFKVHVPDEVDFKLEIEMDEDETEFEVELKWRANPAPPAPARSRAAGRSRPKAKSRARRSPKAGA